MESCSFQAAGSTSVVLLVLLRMRWKQVLRATHTYYMLAFRVQCSTPCLVARV
ncbi:hypothetical protein CY34DRAFT_802814 [Suillus luteus UH-Slu-Lm8-n1]|uniref:Unplaced genomic scaffold CY34scaffold_62, whole genome shotgun sequence n=1 Tax=Suillus luteus UH-Slu-Lm8-n1 TaxID=930992 RepID=A0A0D0BLY3_9AGAM|nr:hypothetical protein CY34DRAFT_802814 [Suillus luteus UH-Slu-Lm8-n1]